MTNISFGQSFPETFHCLDSLVYHPSQTLVYHLALAQKQIVEVPEILIIPRG